MATVNYSVTSPSLSTAVQMELSDADSERMVAWLMAATPYGNVTENIQSTVPNPAWSPDQPDPNDPPEFIETQAWVTRPATPEEASGPVLFLASGLSDYVHGQVLNVTGGQFGGMYT